MTSHDARSSGRTGYTPFEEELVNAMNEFANSADAPSVDTVGIVRKTRRKRVTAIAGLAAALIVAAWRHRPGHRRRQRIQPREARRRDHLGRQRRHQRAAEGQ